MLVEKTRRSGDKFHHNCYIVGSHSGKGIQIRKETNLLTDCWKMEENPVKPEETVEEKQQETKEETYAGRYEMRL